MVTRLKKSGVDKALEVFGGSPTKMARAIGKGVIRQHIEHWLKTGIVPADRAPDVMTATGVPVDELCPGVNWSAVRVWGSK
jgi:DNA-binding transcriptional regulator YdaS (Cro superfamily)